VLLRWVPGESKREELSPADLSALGSYVGGLHNHAERYAHPDPSALPRWDWSWTFGEAAPLWSEGGRHYSAEEMAVFEAAARRVHGDLRELGYAGDAFGPIHRDLNLGNVVFDGGRAGAIDFDKSGMGHYLLDLSKLLNVLRIQLPERFQGARRALLEGYERERPMPAGYRGHLMTFHAMLQVARKQEAAGHGLRGQPSTGAEPSLAARQAGLAAQALPGRRGVRVNAAPIHRSAWKDDSLKFVCDFVSSLWLRSRLHADGDHLPWIFATTCCTGG
jgi:Ser/Thr protein kinase RdoA (MazF antagonist)